MKRGRKDTRFAHTHTHLCERRASHRILPTRTRLCAKPVELIHCMCLQGSTGDHSAQSARTLVQPTTRPRQRCAYTCAHILRAMRAVMFGICEPCSPCRLSRRKEVDNVRARARHSCLCGVAAAVGLMVPDVNGNGDVYGGAT